MALLLSVWLAVEVIGNWRAKHTGLAGKNRAGIGELAGRKRGGLKHTLIKKRY